MDNSSTQISHLATLLLVDDNPGDLKLMSMALEEVGYQVLQAGGAAEGLAMLTNHPEINLVLTDILMPGVDGIEFVESIRKISPSMRVIFVSGYKPFGTVQDETVHFIEKTHDLSKLVKKVREVLSSEGVILGWIKKILPK